MFNSKPKFGRKLGRPVRFDTPDIYPMTIRVLTKEELSCTLEVVDGMTHAMGKTFTLKKEEGFRYSPIYGWSVKIWGYYYTPEMVEFISHQQVMRSRG